MQFIYFIQRFFIIVSLVMVYSCQKVIDYDLNSSNPILMVEANISDQPGPYYVKLSRTVNFDEVPNFPPVTNATVIISDSEGIKDTLFEQAAGIYSTVTLQGVPGNTYFLKIITEGRVYTAKSHMPLPVDIASAKASIDIPDRPQIGGGGKGKKYQVDYQIADPGDKKNYYRFTAFRYKRELYVRRIFNDLHQNGHMIIDDFNLNDTLKFQPGDTVLVHLQNIDEPIYNFYRTFREGTGGLGFNSASPSNPITNLSSGAWGYFSAHSVKSQFVVIPK